MYDKKMMLEKMRTQVNEKRYVHILGVIDTAVELAKQYGADPEKAEIAAILHDYCKCWEPDRMKSLLLAHNDTKWLDYPTVLWHAPAAAYVAGEEFGIRDEAILDAIYYHTTGRAAMSLLEKVLWIADYIEPNRNFDGVDEARRLAWESLDGCLRHGLRNTILFLVGRWSPVYPLTLEAYNYYHLSGGHERS